MKTNIVRYRTCVCNINYHVVWCVKYRRKIITHQKEQFLKDLVQETARDKGFTVLLYIFSKLGRWIIYTALYRLRRRWR